MRMANKVMGNTATAINGILRPLRCLLLSLNPAIIGSAMASNNLPLAVTSAIMLNRPKNTICGTRFTIPALLGGKYKYNNMTEIILIEILQPKTPIEYAAILDSGILCACIHAIYGFRRGRQNGISLKQANWLHFPHWMEVKIYPIITRFDLLWKPKPMGMKQFCFLVICLLLIAACKKTSDQPGNYAYSFTDNGFQFTGNAYTASYKLDSVSGNLIFQALFYKGTPSDSQFINLTFSGNNYIDTGTYSNAGSLTYRDGGFRGYLYSEDYGTFGITKLDTANHLISGTFQFRGVCSLEAVLFQNVSGGVFTNIAYITH